MRVILNDEEVLNSEHPKIPEETATETKILTQTLIDKGVISENDLKMTEETI